MKKLLIGLIALTSVSSFAGTTSMNCNAGYLTSLGNLSYTVAEEDIVFNQEVTLKDHETLMIVVGDREIDLLSSDNFPNEGLKGKSLLLMSNALNEDDTIAKGISLFNTEITTDSISDFNTDITVRTANSYPGVDFSMMDIENGFYISCSKK